MFGSVSWSSPAGVLALDKVGVKDIQVEDFGQATGTNRMSTRPFCCPHVLIFIHSFCRG